MFSKLVTALVVIVSLTSISASAVPNKRSNFDYPVTCDFVLKPSVPVDPTTTNLVAEFNFVIGFSLADATGGEIFNFGSSFTANSDNTEFNVNDKVAADGKTAAETSSIITGWLGETKNGLAANWLVESVYCAPA